MNPENGNDGSRLDLGGKTLFVTGASGAIGSTVVHRGLAAGARLTVLARSRGSLSKLLDSLPNEASGLIEVVEGNITHEESVARAFREAIDRFGVLNAVIHCAAILGAIAPITETKPDDWMEILRCDLYGTYLVVREACRHFKKSGGRIVVFSGGGASQPFENYTAYACSKVGVVRLVETVALEMANYGIEINAVAPGFVASRIHDATLAAGEAAGSAYLERTRSELAKGGASSDAGADAALWLASDIARGITGKLVSAIYDSYERWPDHLAELQGSDVFTLRRIVPSERGLSWR